MAKQNRVAINVLNIKKPTSNETIVITVKYICQYMEIFILRTTIKTPLSDIEIKLSIIMGNNI